ncbi:N-acetylglucosamine kinase [Thermotoga profunda]|uniref:N-acetylglucosamine kinase n=1 Tax=Thermotoga profunda TaxID=1508420 RepID=UPI0005970CB6|nr:BadF/BadG/BcrA/BcrD ATPase family protein [Thermotoga profunda]
MRFLGIDAGGTKTRIITCDETGRVISSALGGPGNHLDIGIEKLMATISECLKNMKQNSNEVDACVLGLSGAGFSKKSCDKLCELMKPVIPAKRIMVVNDCLIALIGSLGYIRKSGAIIVAGTGSMIVGIDENGNIYRVGGWGHIIGDIWSAYGIAFEAVKEVMRYWENRGEFTNLVQYVEEILNLHCVDDVLRYFYVDKHPKSHLASFAPFVLKCARENDHIARMIVQRSLEELINATGPVLKSIHSDFLSYTGGLFEEPYFFNSVQESMKRNFGISLQEPYLPPVGGALIMAMKLVFPVKDEVVQNLRDQLRNN